MLTEPAARPPSTTTRSWSWLGSGPLVWFGLVSAFSLLLLVLASATRPEESIQLTALGAALALTVAFGFQLRSQTPRTSREFFAALGLALAAAFEISVVWRKLKEAPWPPPAWLTGALLLASLAWIVSSAAAFSWSDLPVALTESLLPSCMLAFAALFAAPDFSFRSLGSHSGVWIASGAAITFWFAASAMAPSSIPLALSTFGGSGVLLGLVSGNQTAAALGNVAFIACGLAVIGGVSRPFVERTAEAKSARMDDLLPPLLVALVFVVLVVHSASNPHRETALRVAAGSALTLLVLRQLAMLWRQRTANEIAERERAEFARRASVDALTGLPNRQALADRLEEELERARRYDQPLSLCFIDADYFKSINDRFGHSGGDEALREIASMLRHTVRFIDFVGRYGGEEFLVIAPGTVLADAITLGERLRQAVGQQPIRLMTGTTFHATISVGVAEFPTNASTLDALVDAADVALYAAKHKGRDRVVASSALASP